MSRSASARLTRADSAGGTRRPAAPERLTAGLQGFPLAPGFNPAAEAAQRGLVEYHRESDGVFAGMACQVWRFDDRPDDPTSPSTVYWVATGLDNLVIRLQREVPLPDGSGMREDSSAALTRISVLVT